jgi:hypothetical protein
MEVRIAILAKDDRTCQRHDGAYNNVDNPVHVRREKEPGESQISNLGNEHSLNGEGRGELKPCLHPLSSAGTTDGIAECNWPRVLVRQDSMKQSKQEGIRKRFKRSHRETSKRPQLESLDAESEAWEPLACTR